MLAQYARSGVDALWSIYQTLGGDEDLHARERSGADPRIDLLAGWGAPIEIDRYRTSKPTVDIPRSGGRRAQRAYFDRFRDLAAPSFGLRMLRIPPPECDGSLAYQRL